MAEDIAKLDRQIAALRARKNRAVAKRSHARRRRDAHCKIVLAGSLIALAEREPDGEDEGEAQRVYARALKHARERSESDAADLDAWLVDRAEAQQARSRRAGAKRVAPAQPAPGETGDGGAG